MNYGNTALIQSTLEILNFYPDNLSLRQIDARIAFSVYARQIDSVTYAERDSISMWSYALVADMPHAPKDMIKFPNPNDSGWVFMAESKVPHFTTSYDAAFGLIEVSKMKWSATLNGVVKVKCLRKTFKARLATPQLSLCAVGLMVQLKLRS